ncbi:MAG: hypothetical protein RL753_11, partial [Bacteroidota bacterium]
MTIYDDTATSRIPPGHIVRMRDVIRKVNLSES